MVLLNNDNIIAEITPIGRAGVSAIRLSGPDSRSITSLFINIGINKERHAYYVSHDTDDLIVIYYKGPRSYTGEDVCEIFCHGNPSIVDRLINSMIKHTPKTLRLAEPGEFTKRAYLNGKMDLLQAEAVLDVINSSSAVMAVQKKKILKGGLSQKLNELRSGLLELAVVCEANIDFSDEDLDVIADTDLIARVSDLSTKASDLLKSSVLVKDVADTPKVVIVGPVNVGKSSLFNRLVEYERAIVHHTPGTTRDYIEEDIIIDGTEVSFVDTAGLRDSADSDIEEEGIRRGVSIVDTATIVIEVSDDGAFSKKGPNVIRVLNKVDLGAKQDKNYDCFKVSAKTGSGVSDLKTAIFDMIKQKNKMDTQKTGCFVLNSKNINQLSEIVASIQKIENGLSRKEAVDVLSFLLRDSIMLINRMLGLEVSNEDVLNSLFSRFCIGK